MAYKTKFEELTKTELKPYSLEQIVVVTNSIRVLIVNDDDNDTRKS